MSTRREKAMDLFTQGYNCAQSVVGAFCDVIGLDEDTALKMSGPFGGGMGRLREVCGAVSGMFMVLGILYGYSTPETGEKKKELYTRVQTLAGEFSDKNGSIICANLLELTPGAQNPEPSKRDEKFYHERSCADFVGDAAQILEKFIEENK